MSLALLNVFIRLPQQRQMRPRLLLQSGCVHYLELRWFFFVCAESESCCLCISKSDSPFWLLSARGSKWFTISLQIGWRNPSSASDLYGSNSIYLPRLPGNAAGQKIQFRSPRVTPRWCSCRWRWDVNALWCACEKLTFWCRISALSIFAPGLASFKLNFATAGNSAKLTRLWAGMRRVCERVICMVISHTGKEEIRAVALIYHDWLVEWMSIALWEEATSSRNEI